MTPSWLVLLSVLGAGPADAPAAPAAAAPAATTPAAATPALERAKAALQTLQQRLQPRLQKALADGTPADAIAVCSEASPKISAETAAELKLRMGRTSDRVRNPSHAAPAWAAPHVQAAKGKKAAEVQPVQVDLGASTGVLLPIAVAPACLRCHGPAEALAPEVRRELAARYPGDAATGYAAGDHRGFFWAEIPK